VDQLGSDRLDGMAHTENFVRGKVIEDNHVTGTRRGQELLLDIRQEHGSIHSTLDK